MVHPYINIQGGSNMTETDLKVVYTQISPGHIWITLYIEVPRTTLQNAEHTGIDCYM
jgi:hypothetical protein